ncbi:hypothetical protein ACFLQZ_00985 [Acidobacteriota bacterium]
MKRTQIRTRIILFFTCFSLILCGSSLFFSQENETKKQEAISPKIQEMQSPTYNSAGRRDPFRDLLGRRDVQTPIYVDGVPQIYIDDVILIGIVKARGILTAIINDGQGFPFYIQDGEKFADGFVRVIEESRVIFRKTHERGIPLRETKDIIKELYTQEQ